MHEVPSVHDGPCSLLRFAEESSIAGHCLLPLSSLSQLPFQTHATKEKAGYFMTQEAPGKAFRGCEERCLVAGVIHRHLASLAATSGAESASSKGVDRPAPVESCTQSGTAAG